MFTALEAAEYIEVSIVTFRHYLKAKKIMTSEEVGSTHLYSLDALREFKKALRMTKNSHLLFYIDKHVLKNNCLSN